MDLLVLCCVVLLFMLFLVPDEESEENDSNNKDLDSYKLTHCELHKWVTKSNGFENGEGLERFYTTCEDCGYNPVTKTYE